MSQKRKKILTATVKGLFVSCAGLFLATVLNLPEKNLILYIICGNATAYLGYAGGVACLPAIIVYNLCTVKNYTSIFVLIETLTIVAIAVITMIIGIGHLSKKYQLALEKIENDNNQLSNQNKLLVNVSRTDSLTGINNRLALRDNFEKMLNKESAILFIDIDDFKRFNDQYSHEIGDFVISSVAAALVIQFSKEACYRYGGDEFIVLLDGASDDEFVSGLNNVQKSLKAISYKGTKVPITITVGYCYGRATTNDELRDMLHQADLNLYYAKSRQKGIIIGSKYVNPDKI